MTRNQAVLFNSQIIYIHEGWNNRRGHATTNDIVTVKDPFDTGCPLKIRSIEIDTYLLALFSEDLIENSAYGC